MKILALMNKPSGVDYHRLIKPLTRLHLDTGLDVYKAQDIDNKGIPDLKEYDLIVFNRYLYRHHYDLLEYMAKHSIPYVVDIDDFWKLPKHHPAYKFFRENKITRAIEDAIRYASGVTTTTEELAKRIRAINPKVNILPNALDITDEQWNWPKVKSDRIRIGWLAGSTHHNDALIIAEGIHRALKEVDFDFVYCGWDDNPINNSILKRLNNGEKEMHIHVHRGMNPENYGKMLANLDVVVAPLEDTPYNNCKSDIKIQEAGAYGLPILCSNVLPYSEHANTDGVYLVDDWAEALISACGKLKPCNFVNDIEEVNRKRLEFYEKCIHTNVRQ